MNGEVQVLPAAMLRPAAKAMDSPQIRAPQSSRGIHLELGAQTAVGSMTTCLVSTKLPCCGLLQIKPELFHCFRAFTARGQTDLFLQLL